MKRDTRAQELIETVAIILGQISPLQIGLAIGFANLDALRDRVRAAWREAYPDVPVPDLGEEREKEELKRYRRGRASGR